MLITTTMNHYEDDLDDDLPSVSLSQTCEKTELEMPSASEVASQRAREEAAEQALRDLRDSYTAPRYVSLSRSASQGSSGEEGEAALSAAVSALQVTEAKPEGRNFRTERLELMVAMRDHLPAEDAQFLDAYIGVLKDRPGVVDAVTEKILQTISSALITGWGTNGVCGACAWLLCVSLATTKGLRPRRALHALLDTHATHEHVEVIRRACGALQDGPEQLILAHDAVRSGAGRLADQLADALLAGAMAAVTTPEQEKSITEEPPAPLSAQSISSVRLSWRKMSPRSQLTLLRCAGRALAARRERGEGEGGRGNEEGVGEEARGNEKGMGEGRRNEEGVEGRGNEEGAGVEGGGKEEGAAALLDALSQPLPRASAFHEDRQQVLTNLSKLQLLFRSRLSPDPEMEDLDNSQGSISELTEETPLTGETIMTEWTTITEETSMSVDTEFSSHSTASEYKETPRELTPIRETTMTVETIMKQETLKKEQPTKTSAKEETPKKKQTKLDRFLIKTPTKTETKKEIEEYARSPERKRSRRDRHERRCKKGQKT